MGAKSSRAAWVFACSLRRRRAGRADLAARRRPMPPARDGAARRLPRRAFSCAGRSRIRSGWCWRKSSPRLARKSPTSATSRPRRASRPCGATILEMVDSVVALVGENPLPGAFEVRRPAPEALPRLAARIGSAEGLADWSDVRWKAAQLQAVLRARLYGHWLRLDAQHPALRRAAALAPCGRCSARCAGARATRACRGPERSAARRGWRWRRSSRGRCGASGPLWAWPAAWTQAAAVAACGGMGWSLSLWRGEALRGLRSALCRGRARGLCAGGGAGSSAESSRKRSWPASRPTAAQDARRARRAALVRARARPGRQPPGRPRRDLAQARRAPAGRDPAGGGAALRRLKSRLRRGQPRRPASGRRLFSAEAARHAAFEAGAFGFLRDSEELWADEYRRDGDTRRKGATCGALKGFTRKTEAAEADARKKAAELRRQPPRGAAQAERDGRRQGIRIEEGPARGRADAGRGGRAPASCQGARGEREGDDGAARQARQGREVAQARGGQGRARRAAPLRRSRGRRRGKAS